MSRAERWTVIVLLFMGVVFVGQTAANTNPDRTECVENVVIVDGKPALTSNC